MSLVYGLDRSPNGFGAFSMVLDLSQFSAPLHPPSLIPSTPGRSHQRRITRRAPSDSPRGVPHCIVRSNDVLHARKGREQSPHCKAPPDSPRGVPHCIVRSNDVLHARKGRAQSPHCKAPPDSPLGVPHCIVRSGDVLHARKSRDQSPHCKAPPDTPSAVLHCI